MGVSKMSQEFSTMNSTATEDDLMGRYLTFYINSTIYGIELVHVIDIISVQAVTTVPGTPSYVKGIINLRGSIVPVIDVRTKFNLPERDYDDRTCMIVISYSDMQVAMVVDTVAEVVNLDNQVTASLPEFNNVNTNQYLHSISRVDGHLVLNLDCEKLLDDGTGF